jgi:hypothetical protein
MPKSKAAEMRASRLAAKRHLNALGLTTTLRVHIRPEHKERLIRYVTVTLKGECPTRGKR